MKWVSMRNVPLETTETLVFVTLDEESYCHEENCCIIWIHIMYILVVFCYIPMLQTIHSQLNWIERENILNFHKTSIRLPDMFWLVFILLLIFAVSMWSIIMTSLPRHCFNCVPYLAPYVPQTTASNLKGIFNLRILIVIDGLCGDCAPSSVCLSVSLSDCV